MHGKDHCWTNLIGLFIFLAVTVLIVLSSGASATSARADPNLTGNPLGGVDMWYMTQQSYRKAGLNIQNPYHNPYIVVGLQMTFNLSEAPGYKAKVLVQRGALGEDQDAMIEHQITGFRYGNEKTQQFLFSEDDYLIVDTDYNIQMRPLRADHLTLQYTEEDTGQSYYWDPNTGDWATSGDTPSAPDINGMEWKMDALVEPVTPLIKNMPKPETIVSPDAADAFYADLTLGKTYVFFLDHSEATNFQVYVYRDRDALGVPGKLTEDTLLASTSGTENEKRLTITASYNGRHYIVVRPKSGSGTYELEFRENRNPVAVSPDDVFANLKLGGSVKVRFEDIDSFDPDDDGNGNDKIDDDEDNNLMYHWDFDDTTDKDRDGIYTNDREATGRAVMKTFTNGGTYLVTLTVEDPFGASDTCQFNLDVNYIPIVKIQVSTGDDDNAYVDKKITFNAEGSYDPDDDLDGNGIIDGTEVDHLTYSWDFYDQIDRNMDGNKTNDTDASNKMWLMKYPKAGTYIVTLNVWDNPESADRAYNSTDTEIMITEEPPEWPPEPIDPPTDLVKDPDGKDVDNDVVIRTIRGTDPPDITVSAYSKKSYDIVNIICISAENDDNMLIMTLVTKGNVFQEAVKNENAFYSFYIVGKGYIEPTIDGTTLASTEIDFFYNFTYKEGTITVTELGGETVNLGYVNRTIEEEGTTLVMRVPMHQLSVLIETVEEEGETDIFDIFAVAVYTSSKTEAAETVRIFARDSMGNGVPGGTKASGYPKVWFPKDETPPPNGNGDPDGNGNEQMLYLILGISGAVFIVVILVVVIIVVARKKKKGDGYREYTIARPSARSAGFSVGGSAPSGSSAGPPAGGAEGAPGGGGWQGGGGSYPSQGGGGQPSLCPSCGGICQMNPMGQMQCTRCGSMLPQYGAY